MLGVIVNAAAIVLGSLLGLLFKKGIPEKMSKAVMTGIALCILYIGVSGSLQCQNALVMIFSMVFGAIVGTLLDIDGAVNRLGDFVNAKVKKTDGNASVSEGFVTASLLFCVGAMAIVGSLSAGLRGEYETLFTKSLLDGISACMLAVSLGVGVALSAVMVFLYQGAIVLLANVIAPVLSETATAEITAVGSLLIVALALNMLGITKIKVANFLPALLFAPLFTYLMGLLAI